MNALALWSWSSPADSSAMKIEIVAFAQESHNEFRALMRVGDTTTWAKIIEEPIDEHIVGFNFAEVSLFTLILSRCGLDKRFNDDFARFRAGEDLAFPWDYGDAAEEGISSAFAALDRLANRRQR